MLEIGIVDPIDFHLTARPYDQMARSGTMRVTTQNRDPALYWTDRSKTVPPADKANDQIPHPQQLRLYLLMQP